MTEEAKPTKSGRVGEFVSQVLSDKGRSVGVGLIGVLLYFTAGDVSKEVSELRKGVGRLNEQMVEVLADRRRLSDVEDQLRDHRSLGMHASADKHIELLEREVEDLLRQIERLEAGQ